MVLTKEDLQAIEGLFKDRFDGIDARFDGIDTRLDGIDERLDKLEDGQNQLDLCMGYVESTVSSLHHGMRIMFRHVDMIEKTLNDIYKLALIGEKLKNQR